MQNKQKQQQHMWRCYQAIALNQLCSNMKNASNFKSKHSNEVYQIKKNFNCNSKLVVYLIECRVSEKQYNSSTVTKFRARANNYKRTHRNFRKEQILSNPALNQKHFHEHYRMIITGFVPGKLQ